MTRLPSMRENVHLLQWTKKKKKKTEPSWIHKIMAIESTAWFRGDAQMPEVTTVGSCLCLQFCRWMKQLDFAISQDLDSWWSFLCVHGSSITTQSLLSACTCLRLRCLERLFFFQENGNRMPQLKGQEDNVYFYPSSLGRWSFGIILWETVTLGKKRY